ncbi:hypothetical protein [Rathayibacter sp. Leaf296]|uniref:hypothetical protein n=1 Tax=Rathayibacter sp. Leaf296 TaxID=1736327 RepID=UPI0007038302|nr:hypothetical protein [Rathayibacter sp. Leaf296]KQQ08505.1 hypothetical protein ASF46_14495 [Rathayibacter sp. Leaf296]
MVRPETRPSPAPDSSTVAAGLFDALVDDAGLFPPEELDMGAAVARHRLDQLQESPVLSQRFVLPSRRLQELRDSLHEDDRFAVSVIVPPDASAVADVLSVTGSDPRLALVGVEVALPTTWRSDPDALTRALTPVGADVPVYVEIPTGPDADAALDLLARHGWSAKVRCGGVRAELFPTAEQLASALLGCVSRGVPLKATAGLHHAVRYLDGATGFTHFGFLNILLAVGRAAAGAGQAAVVDALETSDPTELVAALTGPVPTSRARDFFVSYGSCSTSEPLEDLSALNLLTRPSRS